MEHVAQRKIQFRDPFGRDPAPKAFYHPSRQKQLRKQEREIALSPDRYGSRPSKPHSPGDELFLKGTNAFSIQTPSKEPSEDLSSHFDESWPSSERPSYTSVIDSDNTSPVSGRPSDMMNTLTYLRSTLDRSEKQEFHSTKDTTAKSSSRMDVSRGSVLQRYIERFRHGAPMSREERSRMNASRKPEFWWLSENPPTPSDTSTPKDDDKPRSRQFTSQGKLGTSARDHTSTVPLTAHTLQALAIDEKTRRLQERADKLLEESESSLHSSEPAVSTDGLGVSSNGTVNSFEEIPYRPVFIRTQDPTHPLPVPRFTAKPDVKTSISVPRQPLKPEEDILYQWRLRRKMEVAQQSQGSGVKVTGLHPSKETDSKLDAFRRRLAGTLNPSSDVMSSKAVHFTPAPLPSASVDRKADVEAQTGESLEAADSSSYKDDLSPERRKIPSKPEIASPSLSRHIQSPRKTDPHLHLMCDLLPCPHAEKYTEKFAKLYRTSSDFSETEDSSQVQYKQYLQAEKPHSEEKKNKRKEHTSSKDKQQDCRYDEKSTDDFSQTQGRTEEESSSSVCSNGLSDIDEQVVTEGRQLQKPSGKRDNFNAKKAIRKQVRILSEAESEENKLVTHRQSGKAAINGSDEHAHEPDGNLRRKRREKESRPGGGTESVGQKVEPLSSKSGVPKPVHSSSPARQVQSVSSVIGQTISEHLFDGSASAILSSVDSWASVTDHTQPTPSLPVQRPPVSQGQDQREVRQQHPHEPDDTDETYESDGEFPDDHILKMLRHQRAEYEIKLQQIDDLLQQSSFGQK